MITKSFLESPGGLCAHVEFSLPSSIWADAIYLVGDFNNWNRRANPLQRDREGRWIISIGLELGHAYQFRYLVDGKNWTNDDHADAYVRSPYGSDNFVVVTDPDFKLHFDDPTQSAPT